MKSRRFLQKTIPGSIQFRSDCVSLCHKFVMSPWLSLLPAFFAFALLLTTAGCTPPDSTAFIDSYLNIGGSSAKVEVKGRKDENAEYIEEHPEKIAEFVLPPDYLTKSVLRNKIKMALNFIRAGSYSMAKDELLAYLRSEPDDCIASFLLSIAFCGLGDVERQEKMLVRTLSMELRHPLANYNYACLLLEKGSEVEAFNYFNRCLAEEPANVPALYNKASIAMKWGRFDEAVSLLRKANSLDPEAWYICNNLAIACEKSGRVQQAEGYYLRALELNPNSVVILDNLSACYLADGRLDDALALALQWREIENTSTDCIYRLACIAAQQGDIPTAERFFRACLSAGIKKPQWVACDLSLAPLFNAHPELLELLK